ncbi:hypothetical protein [Photorhabdus sp. SF281]|uniref:hypothetical protein n=1 Tax=Photorhabdus sp. SF281 TaxID=3459527 RepID=UPI004044DD35
MMRSQQIFQKALILLDRGQLERGAEVLREAINLSEIDNDIITLIQSLICLGDLLYESNSKAEARILLERALTYNRDDDLLAYEFERAKELLSQM